MLKTCPSRVWLLPGVTFRGGRPRGGLGGRDSMQNVMVNFMGQLDWAKGCQVAGSTLFWGVCEVLFARDEHLNQ